MLEVIYLIFNEGFAATAGDDLVRPALCLEAQRLGRMLAAGPEFKVLALNRLDDGFEASPAVVGREIYLRGRRHLYAIAEETPAAKWPAGP